MTARTVTGARRRTTSTSGNSPANTSPTVQVAGVALSDDHCWASAITATKAASAESTIRGSPRATRARKTETPATRVRV